MLPAWRLFRLTFAGRRIPGQSTGKGRRLILIPPGRAAVSGTFAFLSYFRRMIRRTTRRVAAALALVGLEALALVAVWLLCVSIVLGFGAWWLRTGAFSFDADAFALADALRARLPGLTHVMVAFTWLGTQYALVPAGLGLLAWFAFYKRHRWHSWRVPLVTLGSLLLDGLLKVTYQRPRPLIPHLVPAHGLSYPSGHAMVAASFWGLLWWLVRRHLQPGFGRSLALMAFPLIALLVGLSRVYLHVHYASDVLAGFAAGLAWLLASLAFLRILERRAARREAAAEAAAELDEAPAPLSIPPPEKK